MLITEAKKKKYSLTREEISAIRRAIYVLKTIDDDDEICEVIQCEACGAVRDAQDVLYAILNFDETDILDY